MLNIYYVILYYGIDSDIESVAPFKNHQLLTRVVDTHFHQDDTLRTTMNLSNRSIDLDFNLI